MARGQFTFVVVGRNEAATLPGVIAQARAAAAPGDRVVFVDSASTDDSVSVAESLGIETWRAPEGKGRALTTARPLPSADPDRGVASSPGHGPR